MLLERIQQNASLLAEHPAYRCGEDSLTYSQLWNAASLLAAQLQARGFYEKQGYAAFGDVFYEEHCPHVWMCKTLDTRL